MHKSGLAIITKGLSENNLQKIYKYAQSNIDNLLYVSVKGFSPYNGDWKSNITTCYNIASKVCPHLDVRLLLPHNGKKLTDKGISVVLCDDINMEFDYLRKFIANVSDKVPEVILNVEGDGESIVESPKILESKFSNVCLGGTFDRLHNGHKILLSISALMTNDKLFCGVSSEEMLKNKFLYELIEPLSNRINNCLSFLQDIKPNISYTVSSINHPFGPTIEIPDFDCIVASMETKIGCEKINEHREKKGFPALNIELIEVIDEELDESLNEISHEKKISSSKNRVKLFGKILKSPNATYNPDKPYIIGLTGGIASGKSSIANKLKSFGAEIIDCDKLGHEAYIPGTDCFNEIVSVFGNGIVNSKDGMINRGVLGSIVFKNSIEMKKLTNIVWPAISKFVNIRIKSIKDSMKRSENHKRVIVIDAAVLLDAGWESFCNEVWVSFVPKVEAIERLKTRNKLNEAEAISRIESQKPNKFYIDVAHVIFCTLWSYEYTHSQLSRAWTDLLDRLNEHSSV